MMKRKERRKKRKLSDFEKSINLITAIIKLISQLLEILKTF